MAITLEKFVEVTGAEEVAGNVIVGAMAGRKLVGRVEAGVFSLNDAGQAIAAEIEAGTYGKVVTAEAVEEVVVEAAEVVEEVPAVEEAAPVVEEAAEEK